MTREQLALRPMCRRCGWAQGGLDSWDGRACKCGISSPTFGDLLRELQAKKSPGGDPGPGINRAKGLRGAD